MEYCNIDSAVIAYRSIGSGDITFVIDTCLNSCSAEWWHIGELLSEKGKVLLFDRPGYGKSTVSTLPRTPQNQAAELNTLLQKLKIEDKIVMIGHSQGGYYCAEYALYYPEKIKALLLLDPATPFDDTFKSELSQEEYKGSGVDKTASLKLAYYLTKCKLGFLLKTLLKKSPPFYYYSFAKDAEKYLLHSLCQKNNYLTALEEYKYSHHHECTEHMVQAIESSKLQHLKIILMTHSSEKMIKELQYYGNLKPESAERTEQIWQEVMKRYLTLSDHAEHITAEQSGHYIHLTDLDLFMRMIEGVLE